jgi:hypothetical protein
MSFVDALSRISQIEQQLAQLQSGSMPSSTDSTDSSDTAASTGTSFADNLAQASGSTSGAFPTSSASTGDVTATDPAVTSSQLPLSLGLLSGATSTSGTTLPTAASSMLTSDQQQFASQLASDTGLNPGVISAWLLAEESGSAARSRQAAGNNDWLNIGYTDSATYGSSDSIWADPTGAANATAGWLKGQNTIPGYGTASAGIQGILSTAGQTPAAQISALQNSGWASSRYPDLAALYTQVTA